MSGGAHRARTPLLVQLGLMARRRVAALRPEPFVIDGDIDTTTTDTDAWMAPLQRGGLQADRKLRQEFERRGGWLGKPRKARSERKRQHKAAVADNTTSEWGVAA